jgi:cation diffusion facilitator family transporter
MASTFEGGAILFAGILIMIEGVQTFFHGANVGQLNLGLSIVTFAGLLNGILGYFLIYRGKKFHSEALLASGTHLITDAVTSIGVLVGLFLVKLTGMQWIDPVVAFLFGIMLVVAGAKILISSGNNLMDGRDQATLNLLAEIFEKNYRPGIIQLHFTRVIRSGSHHHIDCHMVIPEFWTIDRAHDFADDFEAAVMSDYPMTGELHVHLDPCRKVYCQNCEIKDCAIRAKEFIKREKFDYQQLISPMENK